MLAATEFWSAIVGAIVGGLIAYLLQRSIAREAKLQRDEDRNRARSSLGQSLFVKLTKMTNSLHTVLIHYDKCYARKGEVEGPGEPWQFVIPMPFGAEPVHFTPEELAVAFDVGTADLFNDLMLADTRHNAIMTNLGHAFSAHRELLDLLIPDEIEGEIGTVDLSDPAVRKRLRPKMINVNSMHDQIHDMVTKDVATGEKSLLELQVILREKLGLKIALNIGNEGSGPKSAKSPVELDETN